VFTRCRAGAAAAAALQDNDWLPVILFAFSRRDCEKYAAHVANKLKVKGGDLPYSFNSDEEADAVEEVGRSREGVGRRWWQLHER
jgi:hypothetical protein